MRGDELMSVDMLLIDTKVSHSDYSDVNSSGDIQ